MPSQLSLNLEQVLTPKAKVYFVGIGGIAMSAAACLAKQADFEVLGSDSQELYDPAKSVLEQNQINFTLGYTAENITVKTADLFVLSAGEGPSNPEVARILNLDLPRCGLAEFLHFLSKDKLRLVISGTNGKTTTTGLIGHLLRQIDFSSFIAGGVLRNYQSNFFSGDGHYFVFEGDEYKEQFDDPTPKFSYLKPDILVLTNLEYDHPDVFDSLQSMIDEFRNLIANLPEDGLIVYNADDVNLSKLVHETNVSSVSFGLENNADFSAEDIVYEGEFTNFAVRNRFAKSLSSQLLGQTEQYKIQLPGKINVYNALAAIACLRALGFSQEQLALDLVTFLGVKRRFEIVGVKNQITVVDDYAHHPSAVRQTLDAARLKYPKAKIWAVFEPHTFSRTKATLSDLQTAFDSADRVLISKIYPAREKASDATIKSEEVVGAVSRHHRHVRLVEDKNQALEILKSELKPTDVVVVMAVGSFNRLAYELKDMI